MLGYNMFTYCLNNPVFLQDMAGTVPTEAVDVDGDGIVDYYRYDYTYTRTIHFTHYGYSSEVTITGSVYIFPDIGGPDGLTAADIPEGFDPAYDLMVGYYVADKDNSVMYAYQAQQTSVVAHGAIIEVMQQYDNDFNTPWERTDRSLHIEWNSHNLFAPFSASAQNIDFDNDEEGCGYIYYCWKAITRGWNTWVVPRFIKES